MKPTLLHVSLSRLLLLLVSLLTVISLPALAYYERDFGGLTPTSYITPVVSSTTTEAVVDCEIGKRSSDVDCRELIDEDESTFTVDSSSKYRSERLDLLETLTRLLESLLTLQQHIEAHR
ncbi:hypothetical protein KC722_00470 [Candidatus Kaiserbacteria bacterium]|nr:hypothetical protein [Candidatus Kaiserbacteria bacterium]